MIEICPLISVFWCQFFTFTDQLEDCRQKTASLRVEWKTLMMNSSHLLSINDCLRKENGKKYICNIQLAAEGLKNFTLFYLCIGIDTMMGTLVFYQWQGSWAGFEVFPYGKHLIENLAKNYSGIDYSGFSKVNG